ncbi:hypothetical protein C1706_05880 [Propioniciclava flava]|uniref:Uncharacterized protein n=1 Tax=Propioniciclava flava TaxID=2072026 RepID=A0A4Q2EKZ7_9ACTN|nr:hypothetical protein C1706_05880 [Propioniciclava flava]
MRERLAQQRGAELVSPQECGAERGLTIHRLESGDQPFVNDVFVRFAEGAELVCAGVVEVAGCLRHKVFQGLLARGKRVEDRVEGS